MNRDIELIDRRIITYEAIIEALRALRSDFEAERRSVAETPVTAPTTSKTAPPLCSPTATFDIQAGTEQLCAENVRLKTKAPAARHSVSVRDRIIEHLSISAMSGSELARAMGYSQVSIYKALRRMRADGIVATREEAHGSKKNFLLSHDETATGACDQNAATVRIDDRSSSPAPGPSPIQRPVAVRRPPGRPPKAPGIPPKDPPPPPGLSIRDQIINLLLVRPMTSAELIQTMGCIPNSVYDALAKMRNTGVVQMGDDSADGVRKNYLTAQSQGVTPKPQPAAGSKL